MKIMASLIAGVFALSLAACQEGGSGKQTVGTIVGGAIGAVAGAQIGKGKGQLAATAVGTLLGAYLGSEVGKSLDRADRLAAEKASQTAMENNRVGESSSWRNPDSGHSGTVTPTRTLPRETASALPCREFEQTVTIDGRTETVYGTACREDGRWVMRNS